MNSCLILNILSILKQPQNYNIFLDAIIDINGNICRNVISAISNLRNNEEFCNLFCNGLVNLSMNLLDTIEQIDFFQGKYKVNKEVFKCTGALKQLMLSPIK